MPPEFATLETELAALVNRYSVENLSDTPDYILARYLMGCLATYNTTVNLRDEWYGSHTPTWAKEPLPAPPDK